MQAYYITYTCKGIKRYANVDAKDRESARNKIARKHGLKAVEASAVKLNKVTVIGYF